MIDCLRRNNLLGGIGLACLALAWPGVVSGQDGGDAEAGYILALGVCVECHAIEPNDFISPNPGATPFQDVASTPGITALALRVWHRIPHPTMPNFVFSDQEIDNLSAYILSLDEK